MIIRLYHYFNYFLITLENLNKNCCTRISIIDISSIESKYIFVISQHIHARMQKLLLLIIGILMIKKILILTFIFNVSFVQASSKTETAGDIGQFLVPLTALGISWYKDDSEGMWQLGKGALYTGLATHTLKFLIEAERPNGKCTNSFPSGHTSAAFSGAAYLHHRYGLEYGLPAYLAASYVGYSRVHTNKHWETDVLAGAALAYVVSYYVTSEYQDPNLVVSPYSFSNSDAQGILLSYKI